MRVAVYYNLHTGLWSIQSRETGPTYGRVIGHRKTVRIASPEFVVQPAGRERVRREKRKNVHAYVVGRLMDAEEPSAAVDGDFERVFYNPYQCDTFVWWDTMEPVFRAYEAVLTPDRWVWAA